MIGMQFTGNTDEIVSAIDMIAKEIRKIEARVCNIQVELVSIANKKRIAAGSFSNNTLSEADFNIEIGNLASQSNAALLCKSDADERISMLKAQSLRLSNLRHSRFTAHKLSSNLKSVGDDYIRSIGKYATAIAKHKSALEQIPQAERINYKVDLESVSSIFASLSTAIDRIVGNQSTILPEVKPGSQNAAVIGSPTITPSSQVNAPDTHKCTFTAESRFCADIYCWKVTDQK